MLCQGAQSCGDYGGFHRVAETSEARLLHDLTVACQTSLFIKREKKKKNGKKWKKRRKRDPGKCNSNARPNGMAKLCGDHALLQLNSLADLKVGHRIEDAEPLQHWGAGGRKGRLVFYFNGELGRFTL